MDCRFYSWHASPNSEYHTQLIGDLRDEEWRLKSEHLTLTEENYQVQTEAKKSNTTKCVRCRLNVSGAD